MSNRILNSAKNSAISFTMQLLNILITFISRTYFILYLGRDSLSLQGLFLSIISILSIVELGIGDAIVFSLYKPLAENKKLKIKSIMEFAKKSFLYTMLVIILIGILLVPFLGKILNIKISFEILIIYFLFLIDTIFSYICRYKICLLKADQKNYIFILIQQLLKIFQAVFQIFTMIFFKSFILFLVIQALITLSINIYTSYKVDKMYKLPKESIELTNDEKSFFSDNIKSIFMYKLGSVVLTGTDNIIISKLLSYTLIGLTTNYQMIISAVNGIIMQIFLSITSSIGNLNAIENQRSKEIMKEFLFLAFWAFGLCSILLNELLNNFIYLWLGEEYIINQIIIFAMVSTFFINGINVVGYSFRTTLGLFKEAKISPCIGSILNIILSIYLGKIWGLAGIFISTTISRALTYGIVDPYLVFKLKFKSSVSEYFKLYLRYLVIYFQIFGLIKFLFLNFIVSNWPFLIIKSIAIFILFNLLFILCLYKTNEFKELKKKINLILLKILKIYPLKSKSSL